MKKTKGLMKHLKETPVDKTLYTGMSGFTLKEFEDFISKIAEKSRPSPEHPMIAIMGGYTSDYHKGKNAFTFRNDGFTLSVITEGSQTMNPTWTPIDREEFIKNKHIKYID